MSQTYEQIRHLTVRQTGLRWATGTSDTGGSIAVMRDAALARYGDGYWDGHHVLLTSGSPAYSELFIHDFLQTDGDVRFRPNLATAPDELNYELLPFSGEDVLFSVQDAILELYDMGLLARDFWMVMVAGSPLYNADFSYWTSATQPDGWTINTSTAARERGSGNLALSETSLALTTAAGYAELDAQWTRFLFDMKDNSVTLYCWVKTSAANNARIAIYDGATVNYSAYHGGDGDWELLSVTVETSRGDVDLQPRLYIDSTTTAYFNLPWVEADDIQRTYPFPIALMPDGPYEVTTSYLRLREDEIASGRGYAQQRQPGTKAQHLTNYRMVKHHDEAASGQVGVLDFSLSARPPTVERLIWLRGDGPLTVPTSVIDSGVIEVTQYEGLLLATRAAINLLEKASSGAPQSARRTHGERIERLRLQFAELAAGAGETRSAATYTVGWGR